MRRGIICTLIVALAVVLAVPAAEARHAPVVVGVGAAVGMVLAAPFIIVGSILAPLIHPPVPVYPYAPVQEQAVLRPPVYGAPAYAAPPARTRQSVVVQPAAGSSATTVQYLHGRYELRGDGVYTAYRWVWIPNAPPPPPPPGAPGSTQ